MCYQKCTPNMDRSSSDVKAFLKTGNTNTVTNTEATKMFHVGAERQTFILTDKTIFQHQFN